MIKRLAAASTFALALFALLASTESIGQTVCSTPGTLGPGSITGTVNTYYAGTAATAMAGNMSIAVGAIDGRGSGTAIAAGDLLLVIQMQDASISTSNTAAYGGSGTGAGYTSLNSSGLFEYVVATGPVAGGFVPLATGLINSYHSAAANAANGQKTYQVIRVPQYSSASVTGTVTAPEWNGVTGGIAAFDVAGQLNWNGQTIDVNGRGFRGGGTQCSGSNGTGVAVANTDYRLAVGTGTINLAGVGSVPDGTKGEGIAGTPILVFTPTTPFSNAAGTVTNTGGTDGTSGGYPAGSFGRGAPGNGGGGGTDGNPTANDQNTGGGGGGNYSIGGKGGFGWTPGTPPGVDSGGYGGMSVPGGTARLFMGGGGGGGSSNNCTGTPGNGASTSGAAGGGMVFVRAGSVIGTATINARGTNANSTITNDASGGGGAGGTVLVFVNNTGGAVGATINVQGGNGGSNTGGGSPHGPGGGGSGGFALLSGTATVNVAGGTGGTSATSATSTADYGSTASSGGFQITNLAATDIPGAGNTTACFPVLTVTKATSTPFVAAGTPATWTITVSNAAGKGAATGVTLTDALPGNPNITYASTSGVVLSGGATRPTTTNPTAGATSPAWSSFTIPGGGSVALTFLANTNTSVTTGTYQNPATVTYLDPTRTVAQTVTPGGTYTAGGTVGGSNYASASSTNEDVMVLNPPPTITKSFAPAAITVGSTSVLTTVINNATPVALANVGLVDNYPAGLVNTAAPNGTSSCGGTVTAAPGGGSFTLTGAAIAATGTCTITVNVTVTATGSYVNTIPVGALTNTQNVSNTAAATATLFSNVTVAKSFSPTAVPPNSDATLTLGITNPNTQVLNLANPGLTDTFPSGMVATGGAVTVTGAGCTGFLPTTVGANATSIAFTAGTLPAGGTCVVSFAVRSATAGIYNNTTSGVTTTQTGITGAPSNTASLGVGLINITKTFSPNTILSGNTTTLIYTLANPTGISQTNGTFLDTLINMNVSGAQTVGGTCTGTTPSTLANGATTLNFSGITIPPGSCTITVVITSTTVGAQPNATNGVTTTQLPQGPGSNTDILYVLGRPTIAKAFAPATIQPGGTSTVTFTITNPGPVALSGMQFTDTYPAGVVNASPLTVGGTCTGVTNSAAAGGNTFNVTAGNLPAAASCTITVQVTAAAQGTYNNTASAVTTTQTGAGLTGSNTATLTVAAAPTISKAFAGSPISQGGTSVLTFTLNNPNATTALTNVNFTDAFPSGLSTANATIGGTCTGTTNAPALTGGATALNLTVPTLAAGATCTITVNTTASISGTYANVTSGVTSTQTPVAGSPSATANLVVLSPPVLTKTFSPGAIESGGTTSIVFQVTNPNATTALTSVTFSDALLNMALRTTPVPAVTETCTGAVTPTGVTAGSTNFTLVLNTLAANESCTITVTNVTSSVMSPSAGHPNTTSTVSSTQTSINPGAAATGNLTVFVPPTVTKSFAPNSIASGGTSVVTFTVTNPNSVPLTAIRFTDDLPANLLNSAAQTFVGGARGTCSAIPTSKVAGNVDPITFNAINLAAGASCTVMMDVTSTTAGVYTNTVSAIQSNQTPTSTTGGSDNLAVGRIAVTKAFGATTLELNGTTTMTFSLFNPGVGNNQNGLTLTDTFPAGLVAVGGTVTYGAGCTGGAPTTIAANATSFTMTALNDLDNNETCTVSMQVRGTTAGAKVNTVTGTAPANFTGSTDTATVTVFAPPTIAKAFSPAMIAAGDTTTLTFTLSNPNTFAALTGAAFTDTLTNMSVAGNQTVGGTCAGTTPATLTGGATALSFTGITIPQSAGSCTVTVVVTSSTPGTLPNTGSGVTTTQTPTVGTGTGAVNLVVAGVNITKAFAPTTLPVNTVSRLTITLTSTQLVNWTGLAFTDTLPANLLVASPANAATTCAGATITATSGTGVVGITGGTMPSGSSPCTVAVDVVSSVTGGYTNNTARFSSLSTGVSAAGASATVTYTNGSALTKSFLPTSIAPGGTSVLTLTVTNGAGAGAASGLGFTDTLPTNVVIAATPGVTNSCGGTVTAASGTGSIALAGGNVGAAPATCTITVNVTSTVIGNYNNNSSNIGGLAGGLAATGANATLSVVGTSLTKTFTPTTIGRNGVSTLTFTITNGTGNPAQSGLGFIENFPANLFVAPVPNVTNTCGGTITAVGGAGTATLAGGALGVGVASCTWTVDVTSAFTASYLNNASRIQNPSSGMDTSGVNATLTVIENATATKAFSPTTVAAGGTVPFTITISNPNGVALTGLAFTDVFPVTPAAMTLANVTVTNTCGGTLTDSGGGALGAGDVGIRLTGGTVPAAGSCLVTVNVTAPTAGSYTNTIAANTITTVNGGAVSTATSGTLTVLARPTITKAFGAATIPSAGSTTLTVTLANANAVALTGAAFTDTLPVAPGAMTIFDATTNNTCGGTLTDSSAGALGAGDVGFSLAGGTIPANGSCVVTVNVTATATGTYNNTIAIGGLTTTNGGASTVAANASLSVLGVPTATKAFSPASIFAGVTSVLTITLNNPNATAITGAAFTDTYPAGVVNTASASGATTCVGGTVTAANNGTSIALSGGTIPANGSCTVTVNTTSNTVGVYTNNTGSITTTNAGTGVTAAGTLTVVGGITSTKLFTPINIAQGGTSTLTIQLTNPNTTTTVTGIAFTDTYPAAITNSATPGGTSNCTGGTVTAAANGGSLAISGASLAPGASCTVSVQVTSTTPGTHVNAVGNITAANAPTIAGDSTVLFVNGAPTVTKSFVPTTIGPGGTSALRLVLANPAGNPAAGMTGISVSDPLGTFNLSVAAPATTTFTPAACGTVVSRAAVGSGAFGAVTAGHLEVRFDVASLAPGVSCQVDINVTSTTLGAANNTTSTPTASGPVATTGTAGSATLTVVRPSLTKAFGAASIDDGGLTTLAFTLTNGAGNPAQSGIGFTETLPASLRFIGTPLPLTYGPGCSGPATVAVTGGNQIALTGIAMAATTASCTITVGNGTANGVSNVANQFNGSCAANPAAFTNATGNITAGANITTTTVVNSCLLVASLPTLTKAFGAATVGIGQTQTLAFSIANTAGGAVARTGLGFTDTLVAGLVIANPPVVTSTACGTPTFTAVDNTQPFTASGISVAAGATCVITLTVRGTTLGAKNNTTADITAISGANNGVTLQTITVVQPTLTKAFAPTTIDQGGTSVLSFTVTNGTGNPAEAGIAFTDTLTAGVLVAATPNVQTNCPAGGGTFAAPGFTVTATGGTSSIAVSGLSMTSGVASCEVRVNVSAANPGSFVNDTGNMSGLTRITNGVTASTLTVQALPTLTKAFGATDVGVSQTTSLTFTITNPAGAPARTGLAFTDTFPAGLVIANPPVPTTTCGGTPVFTAVNNTGTFTVTGLNAAAGASSCTVTVTVNSATAGAYVNGSAQVTSITGMLNGVTNQTLNVRQASLNKAFVPTTIDQGGTSVLTFTVTNGTNNPSQSGINFTDTLPAGVLVGATPNVQTNCPAGGGTFAAPAFTVTATGGTNSIAVTGLTMNSTVATCDVRVNVSAAAAGSYTNNSGNMSALARVTNSVTASTLTVQALPTLTKAFGATDVGVSQTTSLTFTITNPAGAPARTGLAFTDTFPAGLVIANPPVPTTTCGGTPVFTAVNNTGTFTVTGLNAAAGASSCTVTVTVNSATAGAYVNGAAQVTSITGMLNGVTNQTLNVRQASLNKAFVPTTTDAGGTSVLTFTVTNGTNNPSQSGINFTDTLPAGVLVGSTPGVQTNCPAGGAFAAPGFTVTATGGTNSIAVTGLTMNSTVASCQVRVNVSAATAGSYTNDTTNMSALARITNGVTASTLTVQALPTLTKAFGAADIGVGQTTALTFTITNPAGAPARTGVSFTDTLPTNLVIANPPVPTTTCTGTPTFTAVNNTSAFTASGLNVAAGASSCTVTVTVTSTVAASYVNGAAQITAIGGMNNGVTNQTLNVRQASLNKAFVPTTIDVGGTSVLTFTVTNGTNNPAQSGINFTDTLPAGVLVAATPGVQTNCPAGGGFAAPGFTVTATGGTNSIAVTGLSMTGAVASCQVRVNVSAATAGSYTNDTTNMSGLARITNSVTASTLTVQALPTLTKAFGATDIGVGQQTSLTFTITNPAGAPARTGVSFTDTLPTNLVIANPPVPTTTCTGTPTFTAVNNTSAFTASGLNVAAGASSCTVTVTVTSTVAASYVNGAAQITAIGGMNNGVTNQTLNVRQASLDKAFVPTTIDVGGTSVLTFTITNGTNNPAQSGINFTDTLPAGVLVGGTPNVQTNCPAGGAFAAPGFTVTATGGTNSIAVTGLTMNSTVASCQVRVNVSAAAAGSYTNNSANMSGLARLTNGVNPSTLTVQALPTLTKAFGATDIGVGQQTALTFTITNPAGAPARSGLAFTDAFPGGLVIANPPVPTTTCTGTPTFTAVNNTGTFTVSGIGVAAGAASCTVTVTVTSATAGAYVNGAAQVTSITGMNNGVTNQTLNVRQASLNKAFVPTTIDVGGTSVLTFTVTNGTNNPAQSGINFTDTLPAGVLVGGTPNVQTNCPAGGAFAAPGFTVTATGGTNSIAVTGLTMNNAVASCDVRVNVSAATAGSYTNDSTNISGLARVTNGVTASTLTVNSLPTLTKAFGATDIGVGQTTALTFTITNPAGAPARTGLAFTDSFPGGLVIANPPVPTTTCAGTPTFTAVNNTGTFTVSGLNAAAGASSCTVTVTVTSATAGAYVNGAAQVTSITGMNNGVTNQTLNVRQASLNKAFVPTSINVGGTSVLTFTITNGTNNPAQSGINFTDTLPAGVLVGGTPNVQTNCPAGGAFAAPGFTVTATGGTNSIAVTGLTMNSTVASCDVRVNVSAAAAGSYTNDTTNMSGLARITNGVTASTLTVNALPTLTKAFGATDIGVGQTTSLTFTITNPAGAPARTGVSFTDTLPTNLVIANPPVPTTTCTGTPTFTAVNNTSAFTASGLNVAAGASSCTVTVTVTSTVAASYVNGAAQITAIGGLNNGVTNQTLNVRQASLDKAFVPTTIDVGGTSVLTFTITNGTNNPAQTGINFTDTLPAGVLVAATPGVQTNCPAGGAFAAPGFTVTATGGTNSIAVTGLSMTGAVASCQVRVNVSAATAGSYTNDSTNISGLARITNSVTASTLTVQALPTLTKAFGATDIGVGQTTALTFTITNPAGAPARTGLAFTDTFPGGLVIANPPVPTTTCGGTPTFTAVNNTGTFTVSGLNAAAGASSCTVTVTVTSATAGSYVNGAAQVTSITGMNNGVTNQTLNVRQASLNKAFVPTTIDVGGTSVLTFTVTNGTNNPAQSGINFTDTLSAGVLVGGTPNVQTNCPAGGAFAAPGFTVTATGGTNSIAVTGLTMNSTVASCDVRVNVSAATAGAYTNDSTNISALARVTNGVTASTLTVNALPTLTKAFGATDIGVGQTTALTFTITNPAGAPARSGLAFTDAFPGGLVIANPPVPTTTCTGTPTFTAVNNTGTFTVSGIGVNAGAASCTVTVTVTSSTAGAYVNGAAQITSITGMNNGVTNQTLNVRQASLNKAFVPTTIDVAGTSVLTFTIANGTNNPAQSGINFTDTLPAGVLVGGTPNVQTNCPAGGAFAAPGFTVTATGGTNSIAVTGLSMTGAVASCQVRVNVSAAAAGSYTNDSTNISALARVTNGVTASTLTVNALPTLTKAFGATDIGVGQQTSLTFTITNPAGAPARSGLAFTDAFPGGLVIANPPVPTTTCTGTPTFTAVNNTGTFTVSGLNAAAGASSCTVTVTVTSATAGAYVNGAAQVTSITGMNNGVTNQTLNVRQASLNKAFVPTSIDVAGTSVLTFTITNGTNNPAQSGINFTDTLPAGVLVGSTPNVQTNCPAGAGFAAPAFTVTATGGTNSIAVTGLTMNSTVASCDVRVNVSAAAAGSYTNNSGNMSGLARLTNSVTPSTLTVNALPTLTKAFGAADIGVGQTTALTFTISNPAGAPARTGLAFTDAFPGGLVIANPPVPTTTCAGTPTFTAVNNTGTFTVSGLNAAAGASSCTVTVTVTSSTAGAYVNGAAQVTSITGMNNGVTNQTLNVRQATLTKAFSPTSISIGGTPSTLTFTLTNGTNNPAQSGINFTDTLPSGLVVATPNGVASSCPSGTGAVAATAGGSTITVTGASLNNAQASCTISVNVSPSGTPSTATCPGNAANTNGAAQISALARVTNGVVDQCLTVAAATPTLAKAFSPTTVALGGTTTLTFTISQPASNPTSTFSFVDTLSSGLVVGSGAVGGTCSGGTVTATPGSNIITVTNRQLTGTSCTITVPITPAPTPTVGTCPQANNTNSTANISGLANLSTAGLASSCVDVTATRPTISKSFTPSSISSGGTSTLLVTITNANAAPITVTSVTDTFPVTPGTGLVRASTPNASTTCSGGTVNSTSGSVTLTGGTVPANNSCTFQIDVTAPTSGSYANTIAAGALSTTAGTNLAAANATLTVTAVADVSITKSGPATIATGAPIAYTIVISNAGPDSANLTTFSDVVPAAVTGVTAGCGSPTGGAVCGTVNVAGNTVTGTVTTLPAGGAVQITINGTAPGTGTFSNTATVTPPGGTADPVPGNNTSATVVTTVQAPNLTLAKTHTGNFTVGVNGTYTLTVSSSAGTLATSGTITVVDTLPAGLTFVSATGTGWACVSAPPLVTCTSSTSIPAGGSGNPITLTVAVGPTAVPAVTNSATVSGGGEPAALANDNGASDYTIVVAVGVNTFAPDGSQTGVPGSAVFYPHTFTAAFAGNVGFSVSNVPSPAVPGWTQQIFRDLDCNATLNGSEGVTPLTGTIAVNPGDQVCIIVKENIPGAAPGNAVDVVTVTATFNGTQTYTRTDTTTVGPVAGAGLTLSKTVRNVTLGGPAGTSGTGRPNDILEYTITYLNTSGGTVNTIVVTDATPSFTLYQSAACGPLPANLTGCSVTTQPAVNGTGSISWTFTGTLISGGTGTVSFQVRIQP